MKKKSKAGRKTKLTKSVLNTLREAEGELYTDKTLAHMANVTPQTFCAWRKKASTAKSGIFLEFFELLCHLDAAVEERIVNSWMREIDNGNIRAIELALRRHPRLRSVFREEPAEVPAAGSINFVVPKEIKDLFE
ncbi:MAG: hypothetical protein WBZ42_01420 [Halobacteriota archaeon]